MGRVKEIIVKPILASAARDFIRKHHYSGKVVQNSVLHFGCFLNGMLGGVMQFGSSLDKRKAQGLVKGTGWNDFLELNRIAFSNLLPRNSESRCISIALKLIKKHYPHIRWIISFADGCQCGDGTIYRASGFVLTGIKENHSLLQFPSGDILAAMTIEAHFTLPIIKKQCDFLNIEHKYRTRTDWIKLGAKKLKGFQLRYIYFIDKEKQKDLTVATLPFSKIKEMGAGMYKGKKTRELCKSSIDGDQPLGGGANPTFTLQSKVIKNG